MWRTEDGERGETIPLQLGDLKVRSPLDLSVTIAAGPRGVIVVGSDTFTPPHYHGVYVWYSPDGRSFGGLARVPGRVDEEPSSAVVQATPNCFLLGNGTMLLSSEDGVHWQDITTGMPRTRGIVHVSGNSSTVVVFTSHWPSDPPEEPLAWYRHDGTWRPAPMDPGRLPDAGVVPVDQRRVNAVRNWGTGFIAIGNTQGDEGTEIAGMVWYSADGSSWTRMPVRDNGFDTALRLLDIAISRQKAVLVGSPSYRSENLLTLTWQADAPPNP
ncbi:MAG TPA: hypothetical protein VJT72_07135 [Pseudonocardiaceae bacterium]|nr:hypothetical protein [Pseudonocardiaceae bacterium]